MKHNATPKKTRRWLGPSVLIALAILLPFVIHICSNPYPSAVRIAGGMPGSRFQDLAVAIAKGVNRREKLAADTVRAVETRGTLDNLERLRQGKVDAALYQPSLTPQSNNGNNEDQTEKLRFVANLYSQAVVFLVRKGVTLQQLRDTGRVVKIGPKQSADHEIGLRLAEHLGIPTANLSPEALQAIDRRKGAGVDAILFSSGLKDGMLPGLLAGERFVVQPLPHVDSLTRKYLVLSKTKIAAGVLRTHPKPIPAKAVETVAVRAQLITRGDVHSAIIEDLTQTLLDHRFLRSQTLAELYADKPDRAFARSKPPFTIHAGASNVYDPSLKPPISAEFIEATEGLRSFIVSLVIMCFLAFQWFQRRRERSRGGRLDDYFEKLMAIERAQVDLDQTGGDQDLEELQDFLDQVTTLRQEALVSFNAYEMTNEPGVDIFLEMAHAISEKINAKISRQRLDRAIAGLKDT